MDNQFLHICLLLLRLKTICLPWIVLVVLASLSNLFLFSIIQHWTGTDGQILSIMTAKEFAANSLLLVDKNTHRDSSRALLDAIIYREGLSRSAVENMLMSCNTRRGCSETAFRLQYGRSYSNRHTSYIDYGGDNAPPRVSCQVSQGGELNCPFLTHLAVTSVNPELHYSGNTFGRVEFYSINAPENKQLLETSETVCAKQSDFKSVIGVTVFFQSTLMICSVFFYFLLSTVSCIADLKKNGFLRIMFQKGLSVKAFWSAVWLITAAEVLIPALLLTTSHAVHCPNYYRGSSISIIFLATIAQLFCIASLSFLLTVLLHRFFTIGLVLVLIAIFSCTIGLINYFLLPDSGIWSKALLLLLGPIGHFGELLKAHLLTSTETDGVTGYHDLVLTVSILFPFLVVGITIYLDFVLPTGNGYCLLPSYVFDKRFWSPGLTEPVAECIKDDSQTDSPSIQPIMEGQQPIIRISHVSKRFNSRMRCLGKATGKPVVALDDVSVCIYEHQITAIIGHNGSGKTTLVNVISGIDVPTDGQVSMDGLLVSDPLNRIKLHKIVGVCPQENSLCNSLTVMQTLELARISSQGSRISTEALEDLLQAIRMKVKKSVCVEKLSNGMRRKLCTAVALIGGAKVLLLDEPTSGVDALSKKLIWKLLQEYKTKGSVILSTQAMDEANTLADRKIFLSGGAMICAGSSLFLKSAFDCGFDFNVMLKSPTHLPLLVKQIQQEFSTVRVRSQFDRNLRLHLPAENMKELPLLAQALERRSNWISAFGLHQVSLYDIFLRLKDFSPRQIEDLFRNEKIGLLAEGEEAEYDASNPTKNKRKRLETHLASVEKSLTPSKLQNFRALIRVNFLQLLRSKTRLISRIWVPLAFLLIITVLAFMEKRQNNSRMTIRGNLTNFGDSFKGGICLFEGKNRGENLSVSDCAAILTEQSTDPTGKFFALPVQSPGLAHYLNEPSTIIQFRSICEAIGSPESGCPFVYTSEWTKGLPNSDRRIAVGSFHTSENFKSLRAAFFNIGAYHRLLMHFLSDTVKIENEELSKLQIQIESIYDFRGVFINLYGIFAQIVLLTIIPATFLDDLIEDKETKVKDQLSSIGMDNANYWIIMYFVHWIQYAVIYLVSVILIVTINSSGYANIFYLAGIVLPTLLFGLSNNQMFVYILSSLLNKSSPIVAVAYFFFSIFLVLIALTVQLDNVVSVVLIALLPPFATIALTFHGTKAIFYTVSFLEVESISSAGNSSSIIYFSQPHIIASFSSIIVHFIIQPLILSIFENRVILFNACQKMSHVAEVKLSNFAEDAGVADEISLMNESPRNEKSLLELRHINVTFSNGARAVQDVTFSVASGEIFGLLGPNGAGKSTTMAVIVGQIRATSGRCEIKTGDRWRSNRLAAKRGHIGYCPQHNPLYANLTAREHLEFYASILGVSKDDADEQIDLLIEGLELEQHYWKVAGELSFGCKRRLSLATSLLGNPCLLVIDEASTGVDPDGRRFLWRAIRSLAGEKRSIIVTTHSMEEAEALASRVGILNHGCFIGLGAVQQLKDRYGQLYTLELFFATDYSQPVEALELRKSGAITAVSSKFPNSRVIEEFTNSIAFSVPVDSFGRLSHALSWLAEMKQNWQLMCFSFHQMSLDETFIRIISRHNNQLTLCVDEDQASTSARPVEDSLSQQLSMDSVESANII